MSHTPSVFISYSHKDKVAAQDIASRLKATGHLVFWDEWDIRVGECIPTRVNEGLEQAEFLLVLLSRHSVESAWVEREWTAKYGEEVQQRRVVVLPVKIEPCEVPTLLASKKYADWGTDSERALRDILAVTQQDTTSLLADTGVSLKSVPAFVNGLINPDQISTEAAEMLVAAVKNNGEFFTAWLANSPGTIIVLKGIPEPLNHRQRQEQKFALDQLRRLGLVEVSHSADSSTLFEVSFKGYAVADLLESLVGAAVDARIQESENGR